MFVNWKEARALVIHPPQSGSLISTLTQDPNKVLTKAEVEEALKKTDVINITPGICEIQDAVWAMVKDNSVVVKLLAEEKLVVLTKALVGEPATQNGKADDPIQALPKTLVKMSQREAVEMIEGCPDSKQVVAWLEAEKKGSAKARTMVVEAAEKQIAKLADLEKRMKGNVEE